MRIIAKKTIKDFYEDKRYKDSRKSLESWYYEALKEEWKNSHDIKLKYRTASILNKNRVVFNIKGNDYRLIVSIKYEIKTVYIRFVGTHDAYNKINAEEI